MSQYNSENTPYANEAALVNILMYMDMEDVGILDGYKLSTIVDELANIYDYPECDVTGYYKYLDAHEEGSEEDYRDRQRQYRVLANACKNNPRFANLTIDKQSNLTGDYKEGGLEAAVFKGAGGYTIFAYRGTGAGEWIDNGQGLGGIEITSDQQEEAKKYFDKVIGEMEAEDKNLQVIVTGHSKGGNKAQFVTINSEYKDLIKYCYNFDGQGMSPEAIEDFKKKYGEEEYLKAINKMYGFYADNDFVNGLGVSIIPENHITYFKCTLVNSIKDFQKYHFPDGYINDDGSFSDTCAQGEWSKLIENISEDIMCLSPLVRSRITAAVMGVAQDKLGNKTPVNGDRVTEADYRLGTLYGLALVLPEIVTEDIPKVARNVVFEKTSELIGFIINNIINAANSLMDYAVDLANVLKKLASDIINGFNKFMAWILGQLKEFGKDAIEFMGAGFSINGPLKLKLAGASAGFAFAVAKRIDAVVGDIQKLAPTSWDTLVDKVSKSTSDVSKATKEYLEKGKKQFTNGVNACISAVENCVNNSVFGRNGLGITRKILSGLMDKLSVDVDRLSYLQAKMRTYESNMGKMISTIVNEANKVVSPVGKEYSEYNVQQQIRAINMICEEIKRKHERICNILIIKAKGLEDTAKSYKQLEYQFYKDCYGL